MKKSVSVLRAATGVVAFLALGLQGSAAASPSTPSPPAGERSASAHPTGCSNAKHGNGWRAICSNSNGGSYRASVLCRPLAGGAPVQRDPAVWKSSGISVVNCPPLTRVISGSFWTRPYR